MPQGLVSQIQGKNGTCDTSHSVDGRNPALGIYKEHIYMT